MAELSLALKSEVDNKGNSRIRANLAKNSASPQTGETFMTEAINQPLLRTRQLTVEELKTLPFQMIMKGNQITIERGLKNSKLKRNDYSELR